jgi:hypothetical protein
MYHSFFGLEDKVFHIKFKTFVKYTICTHICLLEFPKFDKIHYMYTHL